MVTGWRYRIGSVCGVAALAALAVGIVNSTSVQALVGGLPILDQLAMNSPTGMERLIEILLTMVVVVAACLPLYKPHPRRLLDMVTLAQKRVFVAVFALAAIGYFDYTYRLPRLTLLTLTPVLLVSIPAWFVWIRQRPTSVDDRALIVGDDFDQISQIKSETELTLLGYLCPTPAVTWATEIADSDNQGGQPTTALVSDGGVSTDLTHLGGLSRMEDILVEYDIDTVILAFTEADRAEFFGALDACYEHGVAAKVHTEHADTVLTDTAEPNKSLVDVEIEPWDVQDYLFKRIFDLAFALVGILALLPVIGIIAAAIKYEDGGPILYGQERTAVFGETFPVFKFRSMTPEGESATPVADDDNDRITSVGRFLRQTHLDEIPQLWSILRGDMSVVGPRAVWTAEEHLLEEETDMWRKRWFVKPGLTGLAQINDASSVEPETKLRYDLQYVREQSFWYDLKIVARQIWTVLADVYKAMR